MNIDRDKIDSRPRTGYPVQPPLGDFGEGIHRSTPAEMDKALEVLQSCKEVWVRTLLRQRIALLDSIIGEYGLLCKTWVELGLAAKQVVNDVYATGWEWSGGPMPILRFLRGLRRTLLAIDRTGQPPMPGPVMTRANGQLAVQVYPASLYERLSTPGSTAEVWMEPGLSAHELHRQGMGSAAGEPIGKVCLVLGAGNVSAIPVNDSLSKLFVENQVVLLKMNPVNEYLGPLVERAFRQLIVEGFFRIFYGGVDEGAYLCNHAKVDTIHLTGSDKTYEAIVFGAGTEGRRRKEQRQPVCAKPFTAELGNVAPAIIVPGPWGQDDIDYQAEQLASHLCDNAGCSCSRTRVIVQHSGWPLRRDLLQSMAGVLSRVPPRYVYYPGSVKQYDQFLSTHPQAELYGTREDGRLPWAMIPGIDPNSKDEPCFTTETFCPIIAETALEAASAADFIDRAVDFANGSLWGTLSATILVHPRSLKDAAVRSALDRALEHLRYGMIMINCIPGLAWALTVQPWGSFPGNVAWDIQSGTGFVHNAYMLACPQKMVLRAPFRTWPRPAWFPSRAQRFGEICRSVTSYEREPSWDRLLRLLSVALRG